MAKTNKTKKPSVVGAWLSKDKREQRKSAIAEEERQSRIDEFDRRAATHGADSDELEKELEKNAGDFADKTTKKGNEEYQKGKTKERSRALSWLDDISKGFGLGVTDENGKFDLGEALNSAKKGSQLYDQMDDLLGGGSKSTDEDKEDEDKDSPKDKGKKSNKGGNGGKDEDENEDDSSAIIYWIVGGVVAVGVIGIIVVLISKK
jgi:hypothetical protein